MANTADFEMIKSRDAAAASRTTNEGVDLDVCESGRLSPAEADDEVDLGDQGRVSTTREVSAGKSRAATILMKSAALSCAKGEGIPEISISDESV